MNFMKLMYGLQPTPSINIQNGFVSQQTPAIFLLQIFTTLSDVEPSDTTEETARTDLQ
jgi:hypothetical protein